MKIITRYVLKEHIGPFVFALSALTSLLLLQYIARRFGDLVGRGLSWQIIAEFFLLSIPFTLAMTLPMAVLVSVLYAFSRLASENEITALKAGGVSMRALMRPAIIASTFLAAFMLYFNDQLLPRANHELATLQMAILRTKPTFALRPQVINTIKEGQLYLRAGQIDQATGLMTDVTIYDLTDSQRRKTIYADSGTLALTPNRRDLAMHLFNGLMMTSPNDRPGQLSRVYYREDILKVREVANQFQSIDADTSSKGDREMSVCEMQKGYDLAHANVRRAQFDSVLSKWRDDQVRGSKDPTPKPDSSKMKAGGIGALYCNAIKSLSQQYQKYFKTKEAHAAMAHGQQQDTAKQAKDTTKQAKDTTKQAKDTATQAKDSTNLTPIPAQTPAPVVVTPTPTPPPPQPATATQETPAVATPSPEMIDAKARLDEARHRRNRYGIEIQKKFSLATACIVFVLVGAPLALRFPRGGVGLVIGASFSVFAIYYVGLIGGESLANKNLVSPFWAMWIDNIIFLIVGLVLMARMGHESATSRSGRWGEAMDAVRAWFAREGRRQPIGGTAEQRAHS